jgi:hypothetical protein
MKNKPALPEGLQIVAIIHIDTVGSRELYKDVSPLEKARCAKLLNPFSATGPRFDFFYGLSVRFSEGFWYS